MELQGPVPSLERRNVRFQGVLREVHENVSFSGVVDQPHAPETIALQRSRGPHDGYGVIQSSKSQVSRVGRNRESVRVRRLIRSGVGRNDGSQDPNCGEDEDDREAGQTEMNAKLIVKEVTTGK